MSKSGKIRLSVVLYLNYFIHGIGLIILVQNMRALGGVWNAPLATVSYVISGIGIGRLIAYYALGSLSDRYGRKALIAIGMLSYLIFLVGVPLTSDFRVAYILAILQGIANSALDSGTYPTFLEMGSRNGSANILIKAAMSVGEFVLPLFIAENENLSGWYGWSFVLTAAIMTINLFLLIGTKFPPASRADHRENHRLFAGDRLSPAKIGMLAILSVYGYTSMAVMILYTQWITLYGRDVLQMSNLQAHFLLSLYSAGSIAGVLLTFIILRRAWIRDIHLIVAANVISLLMLLIVCFATDPAAVNIASFLFGLTAAGGIMQVGLNIFITLFPHAKGRVTGLFFSFGSIASFTVPIFTGMLSTIGTAAALRSDIVIALCSCLLWLIGLPLLAACRKPKAYFQERGRIDRIDARILQLLQKRLQLIEAIGIRKRRENRPVFDPAREQEILNRIGRQIADKNHIDYYRTVFEAILTSSKTVQSQLMLAKDNGILTTRPSRSRSPLPEKGKIK
ncbi:MAG: MFS transporter [Sporolactobacillus sp.]|nr:MFS transporter [Sporolactobacillus sp.]